MSDTECSSDIKKKSNRKEALIDSALEQLTQTIQKNQRLVKNLVRTLVDTSKCGESSPQDKGEDAVISTIVDAINQHNKELNTTNLVLEALNTNTAEMIGSTKLLV